MAISSEHPVRRWFGREVLDHAPGSIDPTYLDAGMAVLVDHTSGRHIGIVRNWSIDADKVLRAEAVFDTEDPEAMKIHGKVMRKFLRFTSVGYSVERAVLEVEDENEGNTYRITRWTPLEVSFVSVPADPTVGADRSSDRTLVRVPVELPDSARQARSNTVTAPSTAAPAAASTSAPSRETRLADLADAHERHAELSTWLRSGKSYEEISGELLASLARKAPAPAAATPTPAIATNVHDRAGDAAWDPFGDFIGAVIRAGIPGRGIDPRLSRAASGASEGSASDGGFLIAPTFVAEIVKRTNELGAVLARVRKFTLGANSNGVKINAVNETSRATGSRWGGVQVYRTAEAETVTASKPKYRQIELTLKKLMGLMYLTDELIEDAQAAASIGTEAFAEEMAFVKEYEIVNGNGAGQMLGILNSGAVVSVAKVSGQAAASFVAGNVTAMWARLYARSRRNAVWLIDQSVEKDLPLMTIGDSPVYIPPGGLHGDPNFGMIFGRPVIPVEYLAQLGTVGDVLLADLSQYGMIEKGGPKVTQSMHVRFLYDEQVLKITDRNDGAPLWHQPLTPANGGDTQSPFVTVATRS